jgi:hypothetical protein
VTVIGAASYLYSFAVLSTVSNVEPFLQAQAMCQEPVSYLLLVLNHIVDKTCLGKRCMATYLLLDRSQPYISDFRPARRTCRTKNDRFSLRWTRGAVDASAGALVDAMQIAMQNVGFLHLLVPLATRHHDDDEPTRPERDKKKGATVGFTSGWMLLSVSCVF